MINAKCDHGKMNVHLEGDVFELYADVMTIIGVVYSTILKNDPISAEVFKSGTIDNIETAFELTDKQRELLGERRDEDAESSNEDE